MGRASEGNDIFDNLCSDMVGYGKYGGEEMESQEQKKKYRLYLDANVVDTIERNLALGDSPKIACQKAGIPIRTFTRWMAAGESLLAGEENRYAPQFKRRGYTETDHAWAHRKAKHDAKCEILVEFYQRMSKAMGDVASHILQEIIKAGLADSRNWPALMTVLERTRDDFKQQTRISQDVKIEGDIKYTSQLDNVVRMQKKLQSKAGSALSEEERNELALERLSERQEGA